MGFLVTLRGGGGGGGTFKLVRLVMKTLEVEWYVVINILRF